MGETKSTREAPSAPEPAIEIGPGPHLRGGGSTSRRIMADVLIGLAPVTVAAVYVFGWYAVLQVGICLLACLAAEAGFTAARGRPVPLSDVSAAVTGIILGLSLPWSAPGYVGVVASVVAVGVGKFLFGGLGQNIFNPAMVGRAFVMICFPAALGAAAYVGGGTGAVSQATPLTAAKQLGEATGLWPLFLGTVNGTLGETSALACLLGGAYLCIRRTASWEIPAGVLAGVVVLGGAANLLDPAARWTLLHHLLGGALLFGAFFIATDPVSSPLVPAGKFWYGLGIGLLVMIIRLFSGYPEGVMFAVLLMNAVTPLINRWTIPRPLGGPVPVKP